METFFKEVIDDLSEKCTLGERLKTPFHLACENGQPGIAMMIMKSSARLNINLNAKAIYDWTAFYLACANGHSEIVEIILMNSTEFRIELNAKDNLAGWTAFHIA